MTAALAHHVECVLRYKRDNPMNHRIGYRATCLTCGWESLLATSLADAQFYAQSHAEGASLDVEAVE